MNGGRIVSPIDLCKCLWSASTSIHVVEGPRDLFILSMFLQETLQCGMLTSLFMAANLNAVMSTRGIDDPINRGRCLIRGIGVCQLVARYSKVNPPYPHLPR